jgi:glycerol kinase
MVETTAFGAAALAGLAAGVWSGTEELSALRRSQHVFLPLRDRAACEADYRQWKRAVERSRGLGARGGGKRRPGLNEV